MMTILIPMRISFGVAQLARCGSASDVELRLLVELKMRDRAVCGLYVARFAVKIWGN
ncbi:MAG: hypothetical protein RLZZ511_2571 [Cyanobacteriota bacterium]|jgi:hypothetical protein